MEKVRKWWVSRPSWLVPSVLTVLFLIVAEVVIGPIAARVSALSDARWWAVVPWIAIALLWVYWIRKSRTETAADHD